MIKRFDNEQGRAEDDAGKGNEIRRKNPGKLPQRAGNGVSVSSPVLSHESMNVPILVHMYFYHCPPVQVYFA